MVVVLVVFFFTAHLSHPNGSVAKGGPFATGAMMRCAICYETIKHDARRSCSNRVHDLCYECWLSQWNSIVHGSLREIQPRCDLAGCEDDADGEPDAYAAPKLPPEALEALLLPIPPSARRSIAGQNRMVKEAYHTQMTQWIVIEHDFLPTLHLLDPKGVAQWYRQAHRERSLGIQKREEARVWIMQRLGEALWLCCSVRFFFILSFRLHFFCKKKRPAHAQDVGPQ